MLSLNGSIRDALGFIRDISFLRDIGRTLLS